MIRSSSKVPIVYPLLFVFVLAPVFYLMFFQRALYSDAVGYYKMSLDLLKGQPSDYYWPLGWPLMMATWQWLFGESQAVVKVLSSVLVLLTLYLQLRIVQKALSETVPPWRICLGYGIVLVNAPDLLYHANTALTVVPMAFLGSLLVYALLLTNSRLAVVLLIAAMATVRFGSIFLLPFVLIYYWLRGTSIKSLSVMGVAVLLLVSVPVMCVSLASGKLVLMNTNNAHNLFMGNHRKAPLYENWRWGAQGSEDYNYRLALQELSNKYPSIDRYEAMQREAVKQILASPGLFALRILTRLAVLPAFDSSIGADEWHLGYKTRAVALFIMLLMISLLTKSAAVIGMFGTEWPGRHLIWALLIGLSLPHLIALAHPSYFQMFMNVAIPVIAVTVAKVELDCLRISYRAVAVTVLTVLVCHAVFVYYMAHTRFSDLM